MNVSLIWLDGTCTSMSGTGYNMAVRMYPTDRTESTMPVTRSTQAFQANFAMVKSGLSLTLMKPAQSSLRIYSLDGTLKADLTSTVRGMAAGNGIIPLSKLHLGNGAFIARLDNGSCAMEKSLAIVR
jgi:hypothetical protein